MRALDIFERDPAAAGGKRAERRAVASPEAHLMAALGQIGSRGIGAVSAAQHGDAHAPPSHAVFTMVSPSSSIIASRITNFCTLPVTVMGKPSTKRM